MRSLRSTVRILPPTGNQTQTQTLSRPARRMKRHVPGFEGATQQRATSKRCTLQKRSKTNTKPGKRPAKRPAKQPSKRPTKQPAKRLPPPSSHERTGPASTQTQQRVLINLSDTDESDSEQSALTVNSSQSASSTCSSSHHADNSDPQPMMTKSDLAESNDELLMETGSPDTYAQRSPAKPLPSSRKRTGLRSRAVEDDLVADRPPRRARVLIDPEESDEDTQPLRLIDPEETDEDSEETDEDSEETDDNSEDAVGDRSSTSNQDSKPRSDDEDASSRCGSPAIVTRKTRSALPLPTPRRTVCQRPKATPKSVAKRRAHESRQASDTNDGGGTGDADKEYVSDSDAAEDLATNSKSTPTSTTPSTIASPATAATDTKLCNTLSSASATTSSRPRPRPHKPKSKRAKASPQSRPIPRPPQHQSTPLSPFNSPAKMAARSRTNPVASPIQALLSPARRSTIPSPRKRALALAEGEVHTKFTELDVRQQLLQLLTPGAVPPEIICRDKEQEVVKTFWQEHVDGCKPGSLYISGKPGTGKTATLHQLIEDRGRNGDDTPTIVFNCMSLTDPRQIYLRLLQRLLDDDTLQLKPDLAKARLKSLLMGATRLPVVVLVIDEVDHLLTRDNAVLYELFGWPQQPQSSVVLIGVANALDLTERILPLLHRWGCEPQTLAYEPYTRQQLIDIIKHRLRAVKGGEELLNESAIKLCAAKVTAVSGDVRQTLDLCRRVLEVTPRDKRPHIAIMASLFRTVLGSDRVQRIAAMPLHQKLLLLAMYLCDAHEKALPFAQVANMYSRICAKYDFQPLTSELYDTASLLACSGFASMIRPKRRGAEMRDAKTSLLLLKDDLEMAMQSHPVFKQIFADEDGLKAN
eukprot:TRINITY_DN11544_c0_g4_i3.p1 TRINITY_DN11544_c0_g4~~TRINITY_DN11544_c0_g4_i3.p1  ORF type:complete len:868 (+),score=169.03 TRINITY_DN11544_c0_g4_i3:139-2742(+)